ncbi:hypothetical protein ACOMHN_064132 [Nucella lapillus]
MELGILHNSPPSTKRGCRAGRLHRLWHGLPPAPWPCTRSQHHSVPSRNLHPLMVPPFLQPHPDLQSAVGNAPLSSKHPAQLPTTDCLLSIISPMGGQPNDAPALSPPSPLQQGGQSSNAPALSPPSPLPQGGQPIALALSPPSPPPQGGQPSDAPGLSPSSSTLLLLKEGRVVFGRGATADVYIDSLLLRNFISRRHAIVEGSRDQDGRLRFLLHNQGLNGTYVNDVRIGEVHHLQEGDKVTFGHKNGYKVKVGETAHQPESEFQFVLERFHEWCIMLVLQLERFHEWCIMLVLQLEQCHQQCVMLVLQVDRFHERCIMLVLQLERCHEWCVMLVLQVERCVMLVLQVEQCIMLVLQLEQCHERCIMLELEWCHQRCIMLVLKVERCHERCVMLVLQVERCVSGRAGVQPLQEHRQPADSRTDFRTGSSRSRAAADAHHSDRSCAAPHLHGKDASPDKRRRGPHQRNPHSALPKVSSKVSPESAAPRLCTTPDGAGSDSRVRACADKGSSSPQGRESHAAKENQRTGSKSRLQDGTEKTALCRRHSDDGVPSSFWEKPTPLPLSYDGRCLPKKCKHSSVSSSPSHHTWHKSKSPRQSARTCSSHASLSCHSSRHKARRRSPKHNSRCRKSSLDSHGPRSTSPVQGSWAERPVSPGQASGHSGSVSPRSGNCASPQGNGGSARSSPQSCPCHRDPPRSPRPLSVGSRSSREGGRRSPSFYDEPPVLTPEYVKTPSPEGRSPSPHAFSSHGEGKSGGPFPRLFPTTPQKGQFPTTPQKGQFPTTPQKGQLPTTPQKEQFPTTPQKGQFPTTPQKGQLPTTPQKGQLPTTPQKGQFPTTPQKGQLPTTPQKGQFPTTPQKGQFPTTPQKGQFPRQFPTTPQKGQFHTTQHKRQFPRQFPTTPQKGQFLIQRNSPSSPAVRHSSRRSDRETKKKEENNPLRLSQSSTKHRPMEPDSTTTFRDKADHDSDHDGHGRGLRNRGKHCPQKGEHDEKDYPEGTSRVVCRGRDEGGGGGRGWGPPGGHNGTAQGKECRRQLSRPTTTGHRNVFEEFASAEGGRTGQYGRRRRHQSGDMAVCEDHPAHAPPKAARLQRSLVEKENGLTVGREPSVRQAGQDRASREKQLTGGHLLKEVTVSIERVSSSHDKRPSPSVQPPTPTDRARTCRTGKTEAGREQGDRGRPADSMTIRHSSDGKDCKDSSDITTRLASDRRGTQGGKDSSDITTRLASDRRGTQGGKDSSDITTRLASDRRGTQGGKDSSDITTRQPSDRRGTQGGKDSSDITSDRRGTQGGKDSSDITTRHTSDRRGTQGGKDSSDITSDRRGTQGGNDSSDITTRHTSDRRGTQGGKDSSDITTRHTSDRRGTQSGKDSSDITSDRRGTQGGKDSSDITTRHASDRKGTQGDKASSDTSLFGLEMERLGRKRFQDRTRPARDRHAAHGKGAQPSAHPGTNPREGRGSEDKSSGVKQDAVKAPVTDQGRERRSQRIVKSRSHTPDAYWSGGETDKAKPVRKVATRRPQQSRCQGDSAGSHKVREREESRASRPARKRTRRKRKEDDDDDDDDGNESLEEGVTWYEEDTCASAHCHRPADRRVQWVCCDDCDSWYHTVCVGIFLEDLKEEEDYHCGCV